MMRVKTLFFLAIFLSQTAGFSAEPTAASGNVLTSAGQRFVFGQISEYARHQYMLDTQTGRLWRIVVDKDGAPMLEAIPYQLVKGGLSLEAPILSETGFVAKPKTDQPKDQSPQK